MEKQRPVLVAEDDDGLRHTLIRVMEEAGVGCIFQANGLDEIKSIVAGLEDLGVAIIDGRMPEIGDGEKAKQIVHDVFPQAFIIAYSGDKQTWGDKYVNKGRSSEGMLEICEIVKEKCWKK